MTPFWRQALVWLVAASAIAVTASAGFWQLRRGEEKKQALAALQARAQLPPWANADWPCDATSQASQLPVQQPAVLHGYWLADKTVFLDNRPIDTGSGFIVVTPLVLTDTHVGHCAGHIVLVQRGWVPRDQQDRTRLPDLHTSDAEVKVTGRVVTGLSQVYGLGQEVPPEQQNGQVVRQNADRAFWATWLGQSPLVGALLQTQAAEPTDAPELVRHWTQPGFGQERHNAYAVQWFAMSAVLAGLTIWFQLISPRRQRAP